MRKIRKFDDRDIIFGCSSTCWPCIKRSRAVKKERSSDGRHWYDPPRPIYAPGCNFSGAESWTGRRWKGGGWRKGITVVSLLWMLSAFTACFHMLAGLVVLDTFRGFSNCSPSVPDTSNAVVEEVDVEKRNIGGRREGKLRLITRKNPNGHFIIYVTATSIYTTYIYHGRQSRTQDGHPRITRALLK